MDEEKLDKKVDIKVNIRNKKSILIYLLFAYFLFVEFVFLKQGAITKEKLMTVAGFLLLWMGIMLFSMTEISYVRDFFKKHAKWVNGLILVITPAVSFVMIEIMVSNYNREMFESYSLYNLIWYIIIYYLIFALLRDSRLTIIIGNILIYLAGMLNYLVFLFRGNPILPSDLLAWQTGMSVASNYQLSFTDGFLIATIIMFTVYVIANKLEKTAKKPNVINRLAVLATFALLASAVFHIFFDTDFIKTKIKVIDYFAPKYTYNAYGTVFGFVANVQAMETKEPEGYSVKKVQETLENSLVSAQKTDVTNVTSVTWEKPNIIVIMNEAYSDLSLIGDYKTNMDYRPYTRTLEENTTQGTLYVSVFGGGTSDTEYEFLTGNSMVVLPQNCVPYQQYVTEPTDSLATTLKAQGYYNVAIHPYVASGYKRDLVYPLLGFDEFLSMDNFTDPEHIRSYISDRESYQKIIEEYEKKGDEGPMFIFNVTMQDHGGYSSEQIFSEEETVRLTEEKGYGDVEQYLSLLRKSDESFETLIDYFNNQEEPTIILLFGDHQPVVYSEFDQVYANPLEEYRHKYAVPFLLWANYDIAEDDVDKISANYLSSYLLKTAGLEGTAYNDYLMGLMKEVPVINALFYLDHEDNIYSQSDVSKYSDLITEYKYVGYNNALDKKGKLKQLFRIDH